MAKAIECKGVSLFQNPMTSNNHLHALTQGATFNGHNTNLILRYSQGAFGDICRITVTTYLLSGRHVKGVVQANGAVHPFVT